MDNLKLRPSILHSLAVAKGKQTEARVSQMRAFVLHLSERDIDWLRANAGDEFKLDLLRLRSGIDGLLKDVVTTKQTEAA
jgi:hypothetical protein